MAIFEEKQPSVRWIVLLIAAVFLVSFPLVQIGMNELYSTEGEYAAAALEFTGANTLVTVHGTLPDSVFRVQATAKTNNNMPGIMRIPVTLFFNISLILPIKTSSYVTIVDS